MKKSDLKNGMLVTLRHGKDFIVVTDSELNGRNAQTRLINIVSGKQIPLDDYYDDMTNFVGKGGREFDIMTVGTTYFGDIVRSLRDECKKLSDIRGYRQIWSREDSEKNETRKKLEGIVADLQGQLDDAKRKLSNL